MPSKQVRIVTTSRPLDNGNIGTTGNYLADEKILIWKIRAHIIFSEKSRNAQSLHLCTLDEYGVHLEYRPLGWFAVLERVPVAQVLI